MAISGKTISNPITGQSIRFIKVGSETTGDLLEMISEYLGRSKEPPMHYHPVQQEYFSVMEGELTVKMKDKTTVYKAGEFFIVPAGVKHSMWNEFDGKTKFNWKVMPALKTEYLLETAFGLAIKGKTSDSGMPSILQSALLMNRYKNEFRLAKPGFAVQRLIFGILSPLGKIAGYKSFYTEYCD